MDEMEEGQERPRRQRRKDAKAQRREEAARVKLSVILSLEARRRLGTHAAQTLRSESSLIEELICAHLRRFVVCDRGAPGTEVSADPAGEVRDSAATLPIGEGMTPAEGDFRPEASGQGRGVRRRGA